MVVFSITSAPKSIAIENDGDKKLSSLLPDDYVRMINDVLKIKKNVCLCRYFQNFDKPSAIK